MKVLQLSAHFSPNVGGVETHLDDLCQGLIKKAHQVFVLTYQPLVAKTRGKTYERNGNFTILRLPWLPGLFYFLVNSPVLEFLYLLPGLFIFAPFTIAFYKPNVIHAHGLVAGFIGVFWGKIFNKKVVISTHSIYHFPKVGMYYHFARFIFNGSNVVLCLSDQSVDEIARLIGSKEKIRRFCYWINLQKFKPLNKLSAKKKLGLEKYFVVLFVGRLIKEKGVEILISSSISLVSKIKIVIAGTGPLEEEIKEKVRKSERLVFVGKINNDDLPIYYNAADLLIVPSIHDEGFGRVILESLACGVPVIGSKRGAIKEAMSTEVGVLIDVSKQSIVSSINNMYKHPDKLNSYKGRAREFAKQRYSEKNIQLIIDSYA